MGAIHAAAAARPPVGDEGETQPLVVRAADDGLVEFPFIVTMFPGFAGREAIGFSTRRTEPEGAIAGAGSAESFSARLTLSPPEGRAGRRDMSVVVTCTAEAPVDAGVRVEVRLGPGDRPDWLIPGLFYGENRLRSCSRLYPRFTLDDPRPEQLESDEWSFRADRAATPAVFGWDSSAGAALVTEERSRLGEAGIGFALDGGRPVLRLHWPYREEPVGYDGSARPQRPDLPTYRWRPGETVELEAALYLLGSDRHGYSAVLRDLWLRWGDPQPAAWVSIEDAADLAAWGLLRWHYRADPPVLLETAAFDREALGERGDRQSMHVSWVSGTPYAYALLRHGRRIGISAEVEAATAVLDHIADNLAPAGTFWGEWTARRGWGIGWTPEPNRLHARTAADATLFLARALVAERARKPGHENWQRAVRSNLDAACAMQRGDGAFPSGFDARSAAPLAWDGSAGLAWVPALVEGASAFRTPAYLEAAVRAGHYYADAVQAEFLCGAPEDVDLAPTSEDGYLAVMAYLLLFEHTGQRKWLDLAGRAADWMLTFRYTYDVDFPARTLLGQYRFRTRGADQASPSNQHLHSFGLICLPEMLRLARHTGDSYYLETTRENLACFRQFIARDDGDFNAYRGMVSERYYQTSCFQAKGMVLTLSHAWSVGVLLLACEEAREFPEIYDAAERLAVPEGSAASEEHDDQ